MKVKPIFKHDCDNCVYLGPFEPETNAVCDLYHCPPPEEGVGSVIARWGDEPDQYLSVKYMMNQEVFDAQHVALQEAQSRVDTIGGTWRPVREVIS
jgi:hypothetical protein